MQEKSVISSAVHQMGGKEHHVWADPHSKTWVVWKKREEVMLMGKEITLWHNTGVTFGCLEGVQHRIFVCACVCPNRESVSFSYFWMTWLIVNHTLSYLEVLMCFFSVTTDSRQTDKNHNGLKRVCHHCTRKYKGIHSCQCAHTLSHTHTLTHTQEVKPPQQPHFVHSQAFNQGWWCWSDHRGVLQYGGQTDEGCCHQSEPLGNEDTTVLYMCCKY